MGNLSIIFCYLLQNRTLTFLTVRVVCVLLDAKFTSNCEIFLSYDVESGSKITACNKIDKPLVVYRFSGNAMTSMATLRTR